MKVINYYKQASKKIGELTLNICIGVSILMSVLVFINVLGRYVFNFSLPWGEELPRYLLIVLVFLGSSVALSQGKHVRLMFVVNMLPKKIGALIILIGNFLIVWFLVVLTDYSIQMVMTEGFRQTMPVMRFQMVYIYIWIPIGAVLMLFHLGVQIIESFEVLLGYQESHKVLDEDKRVM